MDTGEERLGRIELAEEVIDVSKRRVTERLRVRTVVDTREDVAVQSVDTERLEISRKRIDRIIERAPEIRTEGDITIVPVVEEVAVVEKKLMLREEVHIRRVRTSETAEIPVTLRSQRAVVERLNGEGDVITETQENDT